MDKVFEDLPVLLVNHWTDVNETLLQHTTESFKRKQFKLEKLTLQYWVEQIRNAGLL
jgi:hypothetical protein